MNSKYVEDLDLKRFSGILAPADKAKLLWSISTKSVPFVYKNANEFTIKPDNGIYLVKVGTNGISIAETAEDIPVAIMFSPPKALKPFSMYYYDGYMLNGIAPDILHVIQSGIGRVGEEAVGMQLDGYFYRVDFVADRNGAVPYNIEINPDDVNDTILDRLESLLAKVRLRG